MLSKLKRVSVSAVIISSVLLIFYIGNMKLVNGFFSTVKLQLLNRYIDANYLYDVDEEDGIEHIYSGYMQGLNNKVSYYIEKEDMPKAKIVDEGDYFGTGLSFQWSLNGKGLEVTDIVKNSVAEKEGVQVGDILIDIDNLKVLPFNESDIMDKLSLTKRDPIAYVFKRGSMQYELLLAPSRVELQEYELSEIEESCYIKLQALKEDTPKKLASDLESFTSKPIRGFILDIRDLSTNNVSVVAEICDLFLDKGIMFKIQTKEEGIQNYEATPASFSLPLVVIMNKQTVGAAEIFALALKDRATLIGANTAGVFFTYKLIELKDGTGVSIAEGKILDQYGNELEAKGINPENRIYIDTTQALTKEEIDKIYQQKAVDILEASGE